MTRSNVLHGLAWAYVAAVALWGLAQAIAPDATFPQGAFQVLGDHVSWLLFALVAGALYDDKRPLAVAAGLVATLHILAFASMWGGRTPPAPCSAPVRIVSANLLMVHPDPGPLLAQIVAWDADVYLLQEYSPRWDDAWRASALANTHVYGISVVREDSFGTAIWSRLPLDDVAIFDLGGVPQSSAKVVVGGSRVELLNVHVLPPRTSEYFALWREGLDALVERLAAAPGPILLTGDMNASPWSKFARDASATVDDAWELAGSGVGWTWPNGVFPLPPARIDHVYISRDLTVVRVDRGDALGSDHAPLRAEVALRAGTSRCAR